MLALLVVLSLILITASFGSSGGGVHSVQAGFLDVLSPIEAGANKVLTPVHDLFNWVGDVFNASSQRDRARKELAQTRSQLAAALAEIGQLHAGKKLAALDARANLAADGPVNAHVIQRSQSVFVSHVTIDAGSGSGVQVDDPVINADGLVGSVTGLTADSAIVTLIGDSTAKEPAYGGVSHEFAIVQADAGDPSLLTLSYTNASAFKVGDLIVTAGAQATQGASFYAPGVPIGTVQSVPAAGDTTGKVTVTPALDPGTLDAVQVLTRVPH